MVDSLNATVGERLLAEYALRLIDEGKQAEEIVQNVSRDFKIPILHFSFDSQTSETGVKTRLEAFYDMVVARKSK